MTTSDPTVTRILILNSDRLLAAAIGSAARAIWPAAAVLGLDRVSLAGTALAEGAVDLLVTGLVVADGDVCALVRSSAMRPRRARHIVVVTRRRNARMLTLLRTLPVDGAFDTATESLAELGRALKEITEGRRYFSLSFLTLLCDHEASGIRQLRALTASEQLVFAVIGDGCDDREAAARLGLSVANIHSIRRSLHAKLHVRGRGELIQRAVEYGLVGISGRGIERLGFALLLEHYEAGHPERKVHTEFLDTYRSSALAEERRRAPRGGASPSENP